MDGPCSFTLPPYDHYVVPAPDQPNETAAKLSKVLDGALVLIIDLNDIGGRILGSSDPNADLDLYLEVLRQNPLGQSREQTPMGVIRPFPNNWKRSAQLFRLCGSFCKKRRFHC